jgi:hypothetical protein
MLRKNFEKKGNALVFVIARTLFAPPHNSETKKNNKRARLIEE